MIGVLLAFSEKNAVELKLSVAKQLYDNIKNDSYQINEFFTPDYFLDPKSFFVGAPAYNSARISAIEDLDTVFNGTSFLMQSVSRAERYEYELDRELDEAAADSSYLQNFAQSGYFFNTPLTGHPVSKDMIFVVGSQQHFEYLRHFAGVYDRIWLIDTCGNNVAQRALNQTYVSFYFLLNLDYNALAFDTTCDVSIKAIERISDECEKQGDGKYKHCMDSGVFVRTASLQYIVILQDYQNIKLDSRYLLLLPYVKVFFCCSSNLERYKIRQLTSNNTIVAESVEQLAEYVVTIFNKEIGDWRTGSFVCNSIHFKSRPVFDGETYKGYAIVHRAMCQNDLLYSTTSPSGLTTLRAASLLAGHTVPVLDCSAVFPSDIKFSPARYSYEPNNAADRRVVPFINNRYIFGDDAHTVYKEGQYVYTYIEGSLLYQAKIDMADILVPRVPRSFAVCSDGSFSRKPDNGTVIYGKIEFENIHLVSHIENRTCAYNLSSNPQLEVAFPALTSFKNLVGGRENAFIKCVEEFLSYLTFAYVLQAQTTLDACQLRFRHVYAPRDPAYYYNTTSDVFSPFILDYLQDDLFELVHFIGHAARKLEEAPDRCFVFTDVLYQSPRKWWLADYLPKSGDFAVLLRFISACDNLRIAVCARSLKQLADVEAFTYEHDRVTFKRVNGALFYVQPITVYNYNIGYIIAYIPDFALSPNKRVLILDYSAKQVFSQKVTEDGLFDAILGQLVVMGVFQQIREGSDEYAHAYYYRFNEMAFMGYGEGFGVDYDNDIVFAYFTACKNTTLILQRFYEYALLLLEVVNYNETDCYLMQYLLVQSIKTGAFGAGDRYTDLTTRDSTYQVYVKRVQADIKPTRASESRVLFIIALTLLVPTVFLLNGQEKAQTTEIEPITTQHSEAQLCLPAQNSAEQAESPLEQRTNMPFSQATADILVSPRPYFEFQPQTNAAPVFPMDRTFIENSDFVREAQAHFLPSVFADFMVFDEQGRRNAQISKQIEFPSGVLAFYRLKQSIGAQLPYFSRQFRYINRGGYLYVAGSSAAFGHYRSVSCIADHGYQIFLADSEQFCVNSNVYIKTILDLQAMKAKQAKQYTKPLNSDRGDAEVAEDAVIAPLYCEGMVYPQWLVSEGFFGRELPGREIDENYVWEQFDAEFDAIDAPWTFAEVLKLITR